MRKKKLEKLTPKQEKLMVKVREQWLERFFGCELRTDRKKATKAVEWLYKLSNLEKPKVIFLSSPLGIQYGANMLTNVSGAQVFDQVWAQVFDQVRAQVRDQVSDQVGAQVRAQVFDQVGDQVEAQVFDQVWAQVRDQVGAQVRAQVGAQVRDQVSDQVFDQVSDQVFDQVGAQVRAQVGAQVRDQVSDQVFDQVSDQVSDQVWAQVFDQVRDQVEAQVFDQVRAQKLTHFSPSHYGNVSDYGWAAWGEYFTKIGVIDFEPFNNFVYLLKSGIYETVLFEKMCIVSDMPTEIHRDSNNRLHNENDFAIKWADGYGQYWIHGVSVTEKIVKTPEKLTKKDWASEENMERRRIIQDRMPNFVKKIGGKEIQKDETGTLLEVKLPNDPEKIARYIKVKDASTPRVYYLRVPPTIQTCNGGRAWSFGLEEKDFNPVQET